MLFINLTIVIIEDDTTVNVSDIHAGEFYKKFLLVVRHITRNVVMSSGAKYLKGGEYFFMVVVQTFAAQLINKAINPFQLVCQCKPA